MPPPRFHHHEVFGDPALVPPPSRMLALVAHVNGEPDAPDCGVCVMPVVAIESVRVDTYSRKGLPGNPYPTAKSLRDEGYEPHDTEVRRSVVVVDGESGDLTTLHDYTVQYGDIEATRLVFATWPATDDADRLAPIIAELKAEAIRSAAGNAEFRRHMEEIAATATA